MPKSYRNLLLFTFLISPFIVYALIKLQPTFDDWTYLTYPNEDKNYLKYILPYGNYWRPFDAIFGYVLTIDLRLFPTLNHIVIYLGHIASAIMVYHLAVRFQFKTIAATIATLFYMFSPAMLGAVLDIDSINQVFATLFALIALWFYSSQSQYRILLWIIFCLLSTLSKENGIVWFFIIPLLSFSFHFIDKKTLKLHFFIALSCILGYWIIRTALPHDITAYTNKYYQFSITTYFVNLSKFFLLTFTSLDFIGLFHQPSRNLLLLVITALLSLPLTLFTTVRALRIRPCLQSLIFPTCILLAASPHLFTIFSTMHAYAALSLVALWLAQIIHLNPTFQRHFIIAFSMYFTAALIVDYRHYVKSYESGMTGYQMAREVINKTHKPAHKAYCICIDHGEKKYSSFCVIPYDAFGWGNAVYYQTKHQWPKTLNSETISDSKAKLQIDSIIKIKQKEGYDHIWIADGNHVRVIEQHNPTLSQYP